MPRPLARRKQKGQHSGFGSLCRVNSEGIWIVKGFAKSPDGKVSRPRLHRFPPDVQSRDDAEFAFNEWITQQKKDQALHLRKPALDVRALCKEFQERAIDDYRRGEAIGKQWGLDVATAKQWAEAQGDIRLADYDAEHVRALRTAYEKIAARPRKKGEAKKVTTREGINKKIKALRAIVKWGVAHKLCQPALLEILRAAKGLAPGETAIPDGEGRTPCTLDQFDASMCWLPDFGRDALVLIRWSAARPSEVLSLTRDELEYLDGPGIYVARKARHKTAAKGKTREVYFAPPANDVIDRLLALCTDADPYLFSLTRIAASEVNLIRQPDRAPHLDWQTLGDWVTKAADAAEVAHWTPYQLRHLRQSEIDAALDVEHAQAAAGHSSATITANYVRTSTQRKTRRLAIAAAMVGAGE